MAEGSVGDGAAAAVSSLCGAPVTVTERRSQCDGQLSLIAAESPHAIDAKHPLAWSDTRSWHAHTHPLVE